MAATDRLAHAATLHALTAAQCADVAQAISLDTKHIIVWVKQNNPKAYVTDRYDKTKQPAGDPDCKLGCKWRHNQRTTSDDVDTPSHSSVSASTLSGGENYLGVWLRHCRHQGPRLGRVHQRGADPTLQPRGCRLLFPADGAAVHIQR
ncbi:MAG: hypothetical protein K8R89_07480 [Anaerolineae bacterium]|nr:hypothetical protein [Anaerolineae bacterium]